MPPKRIKTPRGIKHEPMQSPAAGRPDQLPAVTEQGTTEPNAPNAPIEEQAATPAGQFPANSQETHTTENEQKKNEKTNEQTDSRQQTDNAHNERAKKNERTNEQETRNETETDAGSVAYPPAEAVTAGEEGDSSVLPLTHAMPGEHRNACWERLRKSARAAGLPRGQGPGSAYEYATREVERLFPPPEPEPVVEEVTPEPEPEPEPEPIPEPEPVAAAVVPPEDTGVRGLGQIPEGWPALPSNASLQAEIAWVQSSRLDVVEELPSGGTRVDLARADSPAPSKAAIGWLETSIRAYSKYCDIAAKATAQQEHEAEAVRRERRAIADVRELLRTMSDPPSA